MEYKPRTTIEAQALFDFLFEYRFKDKGLELEAK